MFAHRTSTIQRTKFNNDIKTNWRESTSGLINVANVMVSFLVGKLYAMEHEENAGEGHKIDSEIETDDYLEKFCDEIIERRLKEEKEDVHELECVEESTVETEKKATVVDTNLPWQAMKCMQQMEEFSKSDLPDCFNKEVIFDQQRFYHLFRYDAVQKILASINKCNILKVEKGRKFNVSECCGFCRYYGRYLLFGMSVCPQKEYIEQLRIDLSHLKQSTKFTGNDVLAVFVNWGLKTHLVSNDLEFIYPELATAHSISNLTHILKENWNEVLKSLPPVLDLMKFDNKLEMRTLLKVLLLVSISQEIHPESSLYLEHCIRKLYIRIISENWSEEEVSSLVNFLYEKSINFYALIAIAEKLHTATKQYALSSSLAFLLMQDLLSCNITKAVPGLLIPHMYTVLEKWKPLEMSVKEIYFLTKCLRMCVSGLPSGVEKWEFLRYTERWLDELKHQMRYHSMDSINVQYYISQIIADWYKKYPNFVESSANTSTATCVNPVLSMRKNDV